MMNPLNVFNNPYYNWKYPNYWHKNIRMLIRSFKYAYQRATRGWANCDTWNLDDYYEHIIADTLNYLADNHCGYPGNDEFPDDESWTKYLKDMAQKFYNGNESNNVYPTPEEDKWWHWIEIHPENTIANSNNPYIKSMCTEARINASKREDDIQEGLKMLVKVWHQLWD